MTAVSAVRDWINDECIAIVDKELMFSLENDSGRHWTVLTTVDDAKQWESRLTDLANEACCQTSDEHGPALVARLVSDFEMFDRYIDHLGDLHLILDAEFRFVDDANDHERELVDLWSIGKNDDLWLACHLLIRYAPKLIAASIKMFDSKLHESAALRTLLYLLTDHVHYLKSQPPHGA